MPICHARTAALLLLKYIYTYMYFPFSFLDFFFLERKKALPSQVSRSVGGASHIIYGYAMYI